MAKHSKKRARITCESPAVLPLAPSAITQCPAEIWGRIFALACIDGGFTGRALSCVSRYIMETSRPYKYQCLTVTERQFRPLTAILKKLPADRRRIRYLFLVEQCCLGNGYSTASEFFHTDKNRLLRLAATTLEVLEVQSRLYRFAVPFQLPVLVKLILHGYLDHVQPSRNIVACYPALRYLFLDNFPTMNGFDFPAVLNVTAINLAKIRFTVASYDHTSTPVLPQLKAMTQIQKILLQPEYGGGWNFIYWRRDICLDSQLHDKIVILKPSSPFTYTQGMAARSRWLELCSGHLDFWQPAEDEIDLAAAADAS